MWHWKGQTASGNTLGNPLQDTGYAFCLYDYSAGLPVPIYATGEPAGGACDGKQCWRQKGDEWFVYRDPSRSNEGAKRVSIRVSQFFRARVVASGPDVGLPTLPLKQDPKVTAQLINSIGECWGADFDSPPLTRASGRSKRFRDRS
jgi:hypothetical protein